MRVTVKTGLIASAVWIIIKMSFFYLGLFEDTIVPAVMLNILCLLLAISIGLYLKKLSDKEETNALLDMKNGMSAGVPYVLVVSLFIYLYYSKINPEYYAHQVAEKEMAIHKMVDDPVQLEKFKAQYEDAEVMTKEQIETKLIENNKKGASAGFTATISTLSLLILATLYSILVTIIYRQVIFKRR